MEKTFTQPASDLFPKSFPKCQKNGYPKIFEGFGQPPIRPARARILRTPPWKWTLEQFLEIDQKRERERSFPKFFQNFSKLFPNLKRLSFKMTKKPFGKLFSRVWKSFGKTLEKPVSHTHTHTRTHPNKHKIKSIALMPYTGAKRGSFGDGWEPD